MKAITSSKILLTNKKISSNAWHSTWHSSTSEHWLLLRWKTQRTSTRKADQIPEGMKFRGNRRVNVIEQAKTIRGKTAARGSSTSKPVIRPKSPFQILGHDVVKTAGAAADRGATLPSIENRIVPWSPSMERLSNSLTTAPLFFALFFRSFLQRSLQVKISSQHLSHLFRQLKGRLHTTQIFDGRFSFFTPRGILLFCTGKDGL